MIGGFFENNLRPNPSLWLFIILFTFAAILYHAQYGTIFERESLAEGSLIQNVFLTNNVENTIKHNILY